MKPEGIELGKWYKHWKVKCINALQNRTVGCNAV